MNAASLSVELFVVPCERVSLDDQGRPVLERTLSRLLKSALPATQDVALYAEDWGEPFVTVRVEAQIVGAGGDVVAEHEPDCVALDEEGITLFALPLAAVPLASSGIYTARLLHEGREVARRRCRVDLEVSTAMRTA